MNRSCLPPSMGVAILVRVHVDEVWFLAFGEQPVWGRPLFPRSIAGRTRFVVVEIFWLASARVCLKVRAGGRDREREKFGALSATPAAGVRRQCVSFLESLAVVLSFSFETGSARPVVAFRLLFWSDRGRPPPSSPAQWCSTLRPYAPRPSRSSLGFRSKRSLVCAFARPSTSSVP